MRLSPPALFLLIQPKDEKIAVNFLLFTESSDFLFRWLRLGSRYGREKRYEDTDRQARFVQSTSERSATTPSARQPILVRGILAKRTQAAAVNPIEPKRAQTRRAIWPNEPERRKLQTATLANEPGGSKYASDFSQTNPTGANRAPDLGGTNPRRGELSTRFWPNGPECVRGGAVLAERTQANGQDLSLFGRTNPGKCELSARSWPNEPEGLHPARSFSYF
jgi:hypothetical protein